MCASFETFFNSFIQCSIGLPYFFSIEGKYEAGPVTFFSAIEILYPEHMSEVSIRPLINDDFQTWQKLWRGYIDFYEASIPESMFKVTWSRLMNPSYNEYGIAAVLDGKLEGITHYSFQNSTWAETNYCYLEDLFVNPEVRGKGLGRALIDAVLEEAKKAGSERLYWNTDRTNETARKLYDSYVQESGKVQYRIKL